MKHRLPISDLSLVTNFMSNISFFLRYGSNVLGVTGTLGSEADKDFIQRQFCVDLCYTPTSLKRKLYECDGLVCENDTEWIGQVCEHVKAEVTNNGYGKLGRAALVICEDIVKAKIVYESIKERVTNKIIMYTRSDKTNSEIQDHTFKLGEVIVSTNLAGRGTDISLTKQVCDSGGLYVLVTFLPLNMRVEDQAFGRAGRKGQPGTSQIIVNAGHLPSNMRHIRCIKRLKKYRENKQKEVIRLTEMEDVKECLLKESLFKVYCEQITGIQEILRRSKGRDEKEQSAEYSEKTNMVNSLHEYWGMWLQIKSESIASLDTETLMSDLNTRIGTALTTVVKKCSPTNNIYHIINYGNQCLSSNNYKHAITLYIKAIEINQKFAAIAHYNKAFCFVKERKKQYIEVTMDELNLSHEKLNAYRDEVLLVKQLVDLSWFVQKSSTNEGDDSDFQASDLNRSTETRLQLLKCLEEHIQKSVEMLIQLKESGHDADTDVSSIFDLVHERDSTMDREIYELWKHGLVFMYSIKKKVSFSFSALFVAVLGVVQVAAGIIVLALTAGALINVGVGLIAEGVSDIIDGCVGMYTGEFNLQSWAVNKAVSLAISLVAFSCAKVATKGLRPALSAVKKGWQEVKTLSTIVSKNVKFAGKKLVMSEALKKGVKKAALYSVKEATEQIAMKGVNYLEDKLVDKLMNKVEKILFETITSSMHCNFENSPLRTQVDRLLFHTFGRHPLYDSGMESVIRDLTNIANEVVNPFVSDLTTRGYITNGVSSVVKRVETEMKKTGNNKYLSVFKFIKKIHTTTEVLSGTSKITTLCFQYNELVTSKLEKICDDLDIKDYDNYNIPNTEAFYKRVVDVFSGILSKTVKIVFHQQIGSHAINKVRSSVNSKINKVVSDKLKTGRTMEQISALASQRFAAHMPTNSKKRSATNPSLIENYIKDHLDADSPGSITESRVLSEKLGKNIEVYEMTSKGLKKNIEVGTNSSNKDSVKLLYHKPSTEHPDGHYSTILNGKVVPITNKDKMCLFHAVSKALHPNKTDAAIHEHAANLKEGIKNELTTNPGKWTGFISNSVWAKRLSGGYESMQLGAGMKQAKKVEKKAVKKSAKTLKKHKKKKAEAISDNDKDIIKRYHIGTVGEYSVLQNKKKKLRAEGKLGSVKTNLDHQPAFSVIRNAMDDYPSDLAIALSCNTGIFGGDDHNPMKVLPGHGKPLIVNAVLEIHHKHYLTTGSSKEANAVREAITERIKQNDPVGMFKLTYLASSLKFINEVNNDKIEKLDKLIKQSGSNPGTGLSQERQKLVSKFENIPSITDEKRRIQYNGLGFVNNLKAWHKDYLFDDMTVSQVKQVEKWIEKGGFQDSNDASYKTLRSICKNA